MASQRKLMHNQRLQGIGMTSHRTRTRMVERLKNQGIENSDVLAVINATPRHIFVDDALASRSYEDTALPIGYNQTISQPYIVAKMTELLLQDKRPDNVLEIGSGSGYQTAILAQLVKQVYSVERISALLKKAKENIWDLKLKNVSFRHADGNWGWPEKAPYEGILVAAAPPEIPEALLDQLAIGGVMLIPVGNAHQQSLHKITRTAEGFENQILESVSFVPFLKGNSHV